MIRKSSLRRELEGLIINLRCPGLVCSFRVLERNSQYCLYEFYSSIFFCKFSSIDQKQYTAASKCSLNKRFDGSTRGLPTSSNPKQKCESIFGLEYLNQSFSEVSRTSARSRPPHPFPRQPLDLPLLGDLTCGDPLWGGPDIDISRRWVS